MCSSPISVCLCNNKLCLNQEHVNNVSPPEAVLLFESAIRTVRVANFIAGAIVVVVVDYFFLYTYIRIFEMNATACGRYLIFESN